MYKNFFIIFWKILYIIGIYITYMIIFWLLFAHCLGDMVFQTEFLFKYKSSVLFCMLSHVFIWTGCIVLVLSWFGLFSYWKLIFLFLGHWAVDAWKSRQPKDLAHFRYIYYDQGLHVLQLIIVWLLRC